MCLAALLISYWFITIFSWIFIFPWSWNIVESSKIIEASLSVSIIIDTSHGGCPRLFVNLPKCTRLPLSPAQKVLRTSCFISLWILAVIPHFLHFSTKRRGHLYKTEDAPDFFFNDQRFFLLCSCKPGHSEPDSKCATGWRLLLMVRIIPCHK